MIYFPFDSEEIVEAETEEVTYDRAVDSDVLADWMATFFTNGIDSTISKCLQVSAVAGEMAVTVEPGKIMINGRYGKEPDKRKLTIQAAEDQDRYDYVVAKLDKLNRLIDLYVLKGTKGSIPTAPALTREGDIYELGLAKIFVAKGVTEIKQDRITDMRLDNSACGLISFTGSKVDTTEIFNQYNDKMQEILEVYNSAIEGTIVGQLQADIAAVDAKLNKYEEIVSIPVSAWSVDSFAITNSRIKEGVKVHVGFPYTFSGYPYVDYTDINKAIDNANIKMISRQNHENKITFVAYGIKPTIEIKLAVSYEGAF